MFARLISKVLSYERERERERERDREREHYFINKISWYTNIGR